MGLVGALAVKGFTPHSADGVKVVEGKSLTPKGAESFRLGDAEPPTITADRFIT
jgi:hypothetical protein